MLLAPAIAGASFRRDVELPTIIGATVAGTTSTTPFRPTRSYTNPRDVTALTARALDWRGGVRAALALGSQRWLRWAGGFLGGAVTDKPTRLALISIATD